MDKGDDKKGELEELWVEELIQRKKIDVQNISENDEEIKEDDKFNANYYSQVSNNLDTNMEDDIKHNYMT